MAERKFENKDQELAAELTARFGLVPKQIDLFWQAFTHPSYANEQKVVSNQRLEFLGDSVLGLLVCQYLFKKYPDSPEGYLAKLKSTIVGSKRLACFAQKLEFEKFLRLGVKQCSQGSSRKNMLEDFFEAFLGAYYLNFGLEATEAFLVPLLNGALNDVIQEVKAQNAKNQLQELGQARGWMPTYRTIKVEGPPHQRFFTVEVLIEKRVVATASASMIKEAENKAAALGIAYLKKNN